MIVTRKNLAREALDQALEVREEAEIAFNVPLCVYGLCDRLGVRVQFVGINMEGVYLRSRRPLMQISSLRPLGRRVFTCGHELGHHVFGHGSTLDELQEEQQATGNSNPPSILPIRNCYLWKYSFAECLAGYTRTNCTPLHYARATRGWRGTASRGGDAVPALLSLR